MGPFSLTATTKIYPPFRIQIKNTIIDGPHHHRSRQGLAQPIVFQAVLNVHEFELTMGEGECHIDLSEELEFHGIEYIISVSVSDGPVLVIDVEQVVPKHIFAYFFEY